MNTFTPTEILERTGLEKFSDFFIDKSTQNRKGHTFPERFIDVMSDPLNLLIPRNPDSGSVNNGFITLHNGVQVLEYGYYGDFSEILKLNKGCHEPAEEFLFQTVLKNIKNDTPIIIELGSYWAFYTTWFLKTFPSGKGFCVEPESEGLKIGKQNAEKNNVFPTFKQGFISHAHISVPKLFQEYSLEKIDILHCDIQGYEVEMLQDAASLLQNKQIKYLFISTHSNSLHTECLNILRHYNYRIIGGADFDDETFCYDGIIVACPNDVQDIPFISLGSRKHTPLRTSCYV